jgi:hypothetical protein
MKTFFMFGKYRSEAIREMSVERTQQAITEIRNLGGEITAMNALLGEYAIKASVALNKLTGIAFSTSPAVTVETFDKLMSNSE